MNVRLFSLNKLVIQPANPQSRTKYNSPLILLHFLFEELEHNGVGAGYSLITYLLHLILNAFCALGLLTRK
jgi:hypothetical protein